MNSIFIEGVCGTGKTTLIKALANLLPALTLPELPEFNRGLLHPFDNRLDIQFNFINDLSHEAVREAIYSSELIKNIDFVIADRSYISLVALALSMEDYLGREFVLSLIDSIIDGINTSAYHVPDKIIVLQAKYQSIYERNISKSKKLDLIWFDEDRIKLQTMFYNFLIENKLAFPVSTEQGMDMSVNQSIQICNSQGDGLDKEKIIIGLKRYQQILR